MGLIWRVMVRAGISRLADLTTAHRLYGACNGCHRMDQFRIGIPTAYHSNTLAILSALRRISGLSGISRLLHTRG